MKFLLKEVYATPIAPLFWTDLHEILLIFFFYFFIPVVKFESEFEFPVIALLIVFTLY